MAELAAACFRTVAPADAIPNGFVVPYYLDDRKLRIDRACGRPSIRVLWQPSTTTGCTVFTDESPRIQDGLGGDVLRRVVAYVQANLAEHISFVQLAALAGMSRFHFARQFRISTGQSLAAVVLAADTQLDLERLREIGSDAGVLR